MKKIAKWMGGAAMSMAAVMIPAAPAHADDLWQIYQRALDGDATYLAAQHEHEGARLILPLARSALFPSVSLGASNVWSRDDLDDAADTETDRQYSLTVDQPLFNPALGSATSQAKSQAQLADVHLAQAREDLILRVAERYFAVLAAVDEREVTRRRVISTRRQLDLATERLTVGLGTATDQYDAQARLQQGISDQLEARHNVDNAVQDLRQLTGALPPALALLKHDAVAEAPHPDTANAWVNKARAANLAIRAAQLNVDIAAEEVKKQRRARFFTIDLAAAKRWREEDNGGPDTTDSESSSINATLRWPLYQGGRISIITRQAAAEQYAAAQRLEATRRQVTADTTSTYLEVLSGISRVQALQEAIRAGENALKAKEEGFAAGLTTNIDVLDAQRDLARSRSDYLNARYTVLLSMLRLEQAAGDLDDADLQRINGWLEVGAEPLPLR